MLLFTRSRDALHQVAMEDHHKLCSRPLEFINERCKDELSAKNGGGAECVKAVIEAFRATLAQPDMVLSIPLLTPELWKSDRLGVNTLVRFRGMVQDTLDAEFFVGVHKVRNTEELIPTLFQDTIQLRPGLDLDEVIPHETMERRRVICVSIPGEQEWVMDGQDTLIKARATASENQSIDKHPQRPKRSIEETEQESDQEDGSSIKCMKDNSARSAMEVDGGAPTEQQATPPACTLAYFYDSRESLEPKLNEAVDLIGLLSFDPVLAAPSISAQSTELDNSIGLDEDAADLCPSLVPRLHVLAWCPAPRLFTPTFDPPKVPSLSPPVGLHSPAAVEQAREAALSFLSSAMGGDRVAGEYLLLGLLSRVVARPQGSVVGHLPLNFTAPQMPGLLPRIKACIEELVPRCQTVKVDLASLEEKRWFPHKDYTTNRLVSAALQMTRGTVLLVDETDLQEGQLGPVGLSNLGVLRQMADLMMVPYDFDFYKLDFEADCPFLVLSRTKTILGGPVICEVPVDCTEKAELGDSGFTLDSDMLSILRLYLAAVSELKVELDEETAHQTEADFVAARAGGGQDFSQHDLSRWLTLTRLMCASYGLDRIQCKVHWTRMKALESLRRVRLNVIKRGNQGAIGLDEGGSGPTFPTVQ